MQAMINTTTTDTTSTITFPVDAEHGALRLAVVGSFLISSIVGYFVIALLVPGAGINLIALLGALLLGYGATAIAERILKRRWPSGREVQVNPQGVRIVQKGAVQQEIQATRPTSVLFWKFQTRRRSRVPKGWYVLACALEQDERYLSTYTFGSPDDFKNLNRADRFKTLKSRKDVPEASRGRDDLLLAGEQRRLMHAEQQRGNDGAEMTLPDFQRYVDHVAKNFPEWMP